MQKSIHFPYLLFLCLSFSLLDASAQSADRQIGKRSYSQHPVWIDMMNDPAANYFETLKAFREFWKDRVLPKEPFETEEMESFEKEVGLEDVTESAEEKRREEKRKTKRKDQSSSLYASEVRAFKGWMQGVKPWVRADGSIVSPAERQAIIDAQTAEQKQLEQKNGK